MEKIVDNKILCFEYIVSLLIQWHQDVTRSRDSYLDSFSRLKVLKLLFFVSAVDSSTENMGLLDVFSNFVAMPHGPVESDIYNSILKRETTVFDFPEREMKIRSLSENSFDSLSLDLKQRIEHAVNSLKNKNIHLVEYKPFDLVNISHRWSCWCITYEIAHFVGSRSLGMSSDSIRESDKYYS